MARDRRLNNSEREQWINNDEGLYNWKRRSRLSMREFIRQNREELDRLILAQLNRAPSWQEKLYG